MNGMFPSTSSVDAAIAPSTQNARPPGVGEPRTARPSIATASTTNAAWMVRRVPSWSLTRTTSGAPNSSIATSDRNTPLAHDGSPASTT